jgi:hypothetical protein
MLTNIHTHQHIQKIYASGLIALFVLKKFNATQTAKKNHIISSTQWRSQVSENYRKNVDVYTQIVCQNGTKAAWKVYRPNSMRRVSAVKELNRLKAQLARSDRKEIEAVYRVNNKLQAQVERMEKVLKERVPRSVYEAALNGE